MTPTSTARSLPGSGEERRHLIVAIVNNKPGVLNRVASLMRARNFNIESLAVSVTERSDTSRMTLTISGRVRLVARTLIRANSCSTIDSSVTSCTFSTSISL